MRLRTSALPLSLAVVVSCSADHAIAPSPAPPAAHARSSLVLGLNAATPLYQSVATAINDSGTVVGNAQPSILDHQAAAVWRPPGYRLTLLPDLGSRSSTASSIGNDGTIGGKICDSEFAQPPCHPVYWRNGILHQLGGLGEVNDVCPCDGHALVGRTVINGHDRGAIWEDDLLIDVGAPEGHASAGLVAIAHGYIVGNGYTGSAGSESQIGAYRWSPAAGWVRLLGTEEGVYDVNARGTALGAFSVIWPNGSNTPISIPGEGIPAAINDSGVVAGSCVPNPPGTGADFRPCEWTAANGWKAIGNETFATVSALNNSNVAVGDIFEEGRSFAILWIP